MKAAPIYDLLRLMRAARPLRVFNYFKLLLSYYLSVMIRRPLRGGKPAFITIETGNVCNLACRECPSGSNLLTRARGHIKPEDFCNLLDQSADAAMYLTLYFQGEPFLHPDFFSMIAAAKQRKLYVATSTNAQNMTAENAEKTVLSGLDRIVVSFDGPDQDSYGSYRSGGSWEKVVAGVSNLVNAKKRTGSAMPYIVLQCLMLKANENKLHEVRRLFKELGADRLEFKTLKLIDPAKPSGLLPSNDKYSRYKKNEEGSYLLKKKPANRCFRAWAGCVVTWDCKVLPCCYDKDACCVLGNLNENTLEEIWNGPAVRAFLSKLLRNRTETRICQNCGE